MPPSAFSRLELPPALLANLDALGYCAPRAFLRLSGNKIKGARYKVRILNSVAPKASWRPIQAWMPVTWPIKDRVQPVWG